MRYAGLGVFPKGQLNRRDVLGGALLGVATAAGLGAAPAEAAAGFEILHHFGTDIGGPVAPLIFGEDADVIYGVTYSPGAIFKLSRRKRGLWRFETQHAFASAAYALAGLTLWKGKLYGATTGSNAGATGVVFEFDPATRAIRTLFDFDRGPDRFGQWPEAALVAWKGALYGTTSAAGPRGFGTLFRLTPPERSAGRWDMDVLRAFGGKTGANPSVNGLTPSRGELFGATLSGGKASRGLVFAFDPFAEEAQEKFDVVSQFGGGADGGSPQSPLTRGRDGALYGMTSNSGEGFDHYGTIYRLTPGPDGMRRETIFVFAEAEDVSGFPKGALVEDSSGHFYGATTGRFGQGGTLFRLSPPRQDGGRWRVKTLHAFVQAEGFLPQSGPILEERNGRTVLYGATREGGSFGRGAAYRLTV